MGEEKWGEEGAEMGPVCGVCQSSDDTVLAVFDSWTAAPVAAGVHALASSLG